jgi:hypothetical protein
MARKHKYNVAPKAERTVDGIVFDSKKESRRYGELRLLESQGLIENLQLQPEYQCIVNEKKICKYIGDFKYWESGKPVVEDVKGVRTAVYRLKKKLVEALYGITIVEV